MQLSLLSLLLLLKGNLVISSFLYEIDTVPLSYLFGIVHVPYHLVIDSIPKIAFEAFDTVHNVHLELDLTDEDTEKEFAQCMPQNYKLAYEAMGQPPVLDILLAWKASDKGKKLSSLETPKEKCKLGDKMKEILAKFKQHTESGAVKIDFPRNAGEIEPYKKGEAVDGLPTITAHENAAAEVKKMVEKANSNFRKLLEKRGEKMIKRITKLLERRDESHFFAVGVEHLVAGTHTNLVERIKEAGFRVRKVEVPIAAATAADVETKRAKTEL